jgi:hypothetical protein
MDHNIIPMQGSDRFVIADKDGKIVNDAQGYGYTSKNAAIKAMWYHFGGGKKKINTEKEKARKFWTSNPNIAKDLNNLFEMWVKELCRGEIEEEDLIQEVCKKYSIETIPRKFIEYLE